MEKLTKAKIKYIQSLKIKKNRDETSVFIAEGDKLVKELLLNLKCQILIATSDFIADNKDVIKKSSIDECLEVNREEIAKVSLQKTPQQCLAVFYQNPKSFDIKSLSTELSLVLDGIQDPGNLGTIIRLADWYGIQNIFCSQDTVDVYNNKVVQATMGAIIRVDVHYVNLIDFFAMLPKNLPIYGTFLDGENMYNTDLSNNGLIVMGNEGNGIRSVVSGYVSHKLFIPNYPAKRETSESLNVSIATAIICAEFRRRSIS